MQGSGIISLQKFPRLGSSLGRFHLEPLCFFLIIFLGQMVYGAIKGRLGFANATDR